MKLKHLFTTLLAIATLSIPAFADDEEDTPLSKEMEKVSKALKLVNRNLADASQKDANVAKISDAMAALEKAKGFEPAKTKDIPAADKAKFLADYKAGVDNTIKTFGELKAAVEAGKTEDAAKLVEKLNGEKKEAHKKFKKED